MSRAPVKNFIQGPHDHRECRESQTLAEALQEKIKLETKVECRIFDEPDHLRIKADSYPDYILARNCIINQVNKQIL